MQTLTAITLLCIPIILAIDLARKEYWAHKAHQCHLCKAGITHTHTATGREISDDEDVDERPLDLDTDEWEPIWVVCGTCSTVIPVGSDKSVPTRCPTCSIRTRDCKQYTREIDANRESWRLKNTGSN